jgi:hypothetical protein
MAKKKNENIRNLNKAVDDCKTVEELQSMIQELPAEVHKQLHRDILIKRRELKDK